LKNKIIKNLTIQKLVFKGFGLGFSDSNPIFVYNSVPGDIVDVKIVHQKKDVFFAEIVEMVKHADQRIKPTCEVFGKCGGCEWLNINYRSQIGYKEAIIREIFNKVSVKEYSPIEGSSEYKHYRNKSFMPVGLLNKQPVFGMFAKKSHAIVPHISCKLHPYFFDEMGETILSYIRSANVKIYDELNRKGNLKHIGFRYSFSTGEILVILVTKNRKLAFTRQLVNLLLKNFPNIVGIIQNINPDPVNRILGTEAKLLYGREWLEDEIGNLKFHINYNSFYQINPFTMKKLYDHIKEEIPNDSIVIDAYSGIGSIGLYIADKTEKIISIEENKAATNDGLMNAELNEIKKIEFITGKVENEINSVCSDHKIDCIIFDPPRKGLEREVIDITCQKDIKKIIYVSCNPSTQVRDIEHFIENGYQVLQMKPFDMFPHTYHIENVAVLERRS